MPGGEEQRPHAAGRRPHFLSQTDGSSSTRDRQRRRDTGSVACTARAYRKPSTGRFKRSKRSKDRAEKERKVALCTGNVACTKSTLLSRSRRKARRRQSMQFNNSVKVLRCYRKTSTVSTTIDGTYFAPIPLLDIRARRWFRTGRLPGFRPLRLLEFMGCDAYRIESRFAAVLRRK